MKSLAKSIFLYKSNADRIVECSKRLDWALRYFEVAEKIGQAKQLSSIAHGVDTIKAGVDKIESGVQELNTNITKVLAQGTVTSFPTTSLPPPPAIFFGRNDLVSELSRWVASTPAVRFAILGPGGMGKTSLASAVLCHPAVVERFGDRRHWALCETAGSYDLLIGIVARSLGINQPSGDVMYLINAFVRTSLEPRLIVLDNFETPWDISGSQSRVLDVLCSLFSFPHLAIILTMRGTLPGLGRITWTKPILPPLEVLSSEAAQQLYVEIHQGASVDPHLAALLRELGYLPLAIRLMATVGAEGEVSPTALLRRWKAEGVAAIDQPEGDRLTSLEKSIKWSLESNTVRNSPSSILLLSVIAFLPTGIRVSFLEDLVPSIDSAPTALSALKRTSLIYSTDKGESYSSASCKANAPRTRLIPQRETKPAASRNVSPSCFESSINSS